MKWFNVVLLGDSGVGKTALLQRLVAEKYSSTFIATVGVDLKRKQFDDLDAGLQVCGLDSVSFKGSGEGGGRVWESCLYGENIAGMGHCWPRTVPVNHHSVLPRRRSEYEDREVI
jgi:GTPase SAR1 family protein